MTRIDYAYTGEALPARGSPSRYFPYITSGTSLSLPDLDKLRSERQDCDLYLSILVPTELLTALVNNGSIARGARSIAYDNGTGSAGNFALIEEGQTLVIETGDGPKRVRVKSITGNQVSGTITVDENAIDLSDNNPITILHHYEIWPVPPRISGGIFYKYYDLAYSDQNEQPPPVAIAGPHQAGFLVAGSLILYVPIGDSYATASGATISTKVVTVVPSAGVTVGAEASGFIPVTYTAAGTYWVKTVVTDSNSKVQTTYRVHFVYDANNLPYSQFSLGTLSGNWQSGGYRVTITATGDVTLDDFPDGALALLWYVNQYDAVESYVNLWTVGDNVLTAGYVSRDNDLDDYQTGTGQVEFDLLTPEALLDGMTDFGSVSIVSVAAPSTWYQYDTWMTVGRVVHHELRWHSTVFSCADIYGLLDNTLGVERCEFTEPSLLQRVNGLGYSRGIFARLVSDRLGRLHFVEDSQMLNDAGRAGLDTVFTLLDDDISGAINLTRQQIERAGSVDLDGFAWDGATATPYVSICPGYSTGISFAEFRGTGSSPIKNQVLGSQTDANEKTGRILAALNNNLQEQRLSFPYGGIGAFDIVPSIGWYEWGITNASLKRALELNGKKFICRSVDHEFIYGQGGAFAGEIRTSAIFEIEAQGPDGVPISNYPTSYPAVTNPPAPTWTQTQSELIFGSIVVLVNTQGYRYLALGEIYAVGELLFLVEYGAGITDPPSEAGIITVTGTTPAASAVGNPYGTVKADTNQVSLALIPTTEKGLSLFGSGAVNAPRAQVLYDNAGTIAGGVSDLYSGTSPYDSFDVACLNSQDGIGVFREDIGGSPNGKAVYLGITEATNDIAVGSAIDLNGSTRDCQNMSICRLDDDHAAVIYADNGNSGYPTAVIVNENATTLTAGTPAALDTSEAMFTVVAPEDLPRRRVVALDANTFVAVYGRATTEDCRIVACNFTGTTIDSVGTPVTIGAGYKYVCLDKVSATKVLAVYVTTNSIKAQTFTVSGTTLTADGNEAELVVALLPSFINIRILSATQAVIAWTGSSGNTDVYGAVITIP